MPSSHSQVIFYQIICKDLEVKDIYVGHTYNNFKSEKMKHIISCSTSTCPNRNSKLYKCIRENGGLKNWSMTIIDTHSLHEYLDALKIERKYAEEKGATLSRPYFDSCEEACEYYKNRDIERFKEMVHCACGSDIQRYYKNKHEKTNKHQAYLKSLDNPQEV